MKAIYLKRGKNGRKGFILIAIFIGIIALGILAGTVGPSIHSSLDAADLRAERDALTVLKNEIESSFNESDFTRNIGALSGTGLSGSSTYATTGEDRTQPGTGFATSRTVSAYSWQSKVCNLRSVSLTNGSTVNKNADPSGVYFNRLGWSRMVLIGPTTETSQRYLIVSMMTPEHRQLAFPTGATVFDEMWNNSWDNAGATAPGAWSSSLSAANYALWNEKSVNNRTNASRLMVQRVVQPKYVLTVISNHPTDGAWIDIGPISNAIIAAANGGSYSSSSVSELTNGIPAGRLIVVRRGTSSGTAVEVQRFQMTSASTITIQ